MRYWRTPSLTQLLLIFLGVAANATRGLDDVPAGSEVKEDNGQVTINDDPTANNTVPDIPVSATIFSGVPGPSHCRGQPILRLDIPTSSPPAAARCHNMPRPVGCGTFIANKEDGCEARLFTEPDCRMYANTAVFVPQERVVGGLWRSMSIQCGIPPPDPATLGSPPFQDLLRNAKKTPKTGS